MNIQRKSTNIAPKTLTVTRQRAGQRLDNYLFSNLKGVPKSHVYRLVRSGRIRVNKGRCRPERRLQEGDVVRLPPVRTGKPAGQTDTGDLAWLERGILYEDRDLLVVNKPGGLAVHGGSGISLGLIEGLRRLRPKAKFLELAHRLDRDTSGCLLVAKRRSALLDLHRQLREGRVQKCYIALTKGKWRGGARRIEAPLEKNRLRSGERMVRVAQAGKAAASRFRPLKFLRHEGEILATTVEITLLTGRTHQARVHAAHIRHPIAGDEKYGDREFNQVMRKLGLKRMFLHASELTFMHPESGSKMRLNAPLPDDLSQILDNAEING